MNWVQFLKHLQLRLALEKNLVTPETIIKDITSKIKCSIHEISDIKKFPKDLSVEDILVRSSNIGSLNCKINWQRKI